VRSFLRVMPFYGAALVLTMLAAVVLGPAVGRRLGTRGSVGGLLIFGFGVVLGATLLPDAQGLAGQATDGICDTSHVGLLSLRELITVNQRSLNVLLFVPLGLAVGMLPVSRPAVAITIAAISLTFVVEGIQLFVTVLGRGCQTADLFDNMLGLMIGIVVGVMARPLLGLRRA
jgi:hypothetical protein